MKLTKKEIIDLLPHREPMLLIDELIDIKKLHSATAIMNVKKGAFYVDGHFPGNPVIDSPFFPGTPGAPRSPFGASNTAQFNGSFEDPTETDICLFWFFIRLEEAVNG